MPEKKKKVTKQNESILWFFNIVGINIEFPQCVSSTFSCQVSISALQKVGERNYHARIVKEMFWKRLTYFLVNKDVMFKGNNQTGDVTWLNSHLDGSTKCLFFDVLLQHFQLESKCHNSNASYCKILWFIEWSIPYITLKKDMRPWYRTATFKKFNLFFFFVVH